MGEENIINSIGINWRRGNERLITFVTSMSNDGKTFTNVLSSKNIGSTLNLEKYYLVDTNAKYIRITVNENN